MKTWGVNQGVIRIDFLKYRRILGLNPEISIEDAMHSLNPEEPESNEKIILPKSSKSLYLHFDITGMEEPIHVDGSFHG